MYPRTMVFAYDIQDDRRRRRTLRRLREWRLDGQLSVHECRLSSAGAARLFAQLTADMDPATDRLLLAAVQADRPILVRGIGRAAPATTGLWLAV